VCWGKGRDGALSPGGVAEAVLPDESGTLKDAVADNKAKHTKADFILRIVPWKF
jgi:hypothetical protein